jgi:hypothetical protein
MSLSLKRKFLIFIVILFNLFGVALLYLYMKDQDNMYAENGIKYNAKVVEKDFFVYEHGKWEKKFLKGVNLGAAKPGHYPGELAITKEEYLRWFGYIKDMNAEVIRVYTTQNPEFYEALYEFNKKSKEPLYIIQGVWVNEEDISTLMDPYVENEKIKEDFIKDAKDLVDIFHGQAVLEDKQGFASGSFEFDVSEYVIGWIMGIEWDPGFVNNTNEMNPDRNIYKGDYLYTKDASAFESFLCEVGDRVLKYEIDKYKMTRPLSFSSWPTTDMLKHSNEPFINEDSAVVNMEKIGSQKAALSGLFASYHIYPYYPDFLNYQGEYVEFKDEEGKVNTYKAYLRDLFKEHTMPVMVAEFGVPASRGKAHDAIHSGFNQGQHDEKRQGEIIIELMKDIYDEGYCGALVFTWQDEWFKRTWNTMDFDDPDGRPYWSNPQTNEQQFGLLAFDPGEEKSVVYVDGEIDDWKDEQPVVVNDDMELFVNSDEKYVYLMVKSEKVDLKNEEIYIPIDSIEGQGNSNVANGSLNFNRPADFLIEIDGRFNTRIMVDAYYDSFYYLYGHKLKMIPEVAEYTTKGSGIFNRLYHNLSREFMLPVDGSIIPFSQYETGLLTYGNANPASKNFNSLSDFIFGEGVVEIRIPWQLLNVMNPADKLNMDDLYVSDGINPVSISNMYFGLGTINESSINMEYYGWYKWDLPTYHERLKDSYYILKEEFLKFE